ncbi:type 2 glycerol-3-phosphate oxidase [Spiroplasma floricola]|uniref:Glycerol-3-phosphate oxidase n=1 Tax=Spiroplasma floricola 23-6 TaxID=1336749 RepID=A0A2K8SDU2_9MOLU|nr:type 2 glycerol-3-phosphate oxidase [Spiroplasma floricola]AUB31626.1 glycerol-3-phosphate oxidase [Spiroplasma floricola 23-6]
MSNQKYDICIIGAGIIGASIARELSKYNLNILVLESNVSYGLETTTGNSGVIHGGFDPTPGKLNAKLNQRGKKLYRERWFKELDFKHLPINSLVIAFNEEEEKHLEILYKNGFINGLEKEEIKLIEKDEVLKLQPNISNKVTKALLCNSSIAIDAVELTGVLLKNAKRNSCDVKFNQKVMKIEKQKEEFIIQTNDSNYNSKMIINCAGHYADEISKMAGYDEYKLDTRRGEYIVLKKSKDNFVNNIIFLVPTIWGKGVIVAPTMDGNILVGPTSQEGVGKEETSLITNEKEKLIMDIGKKIMPNLDYSKIAKRFSGSRPIYKATDDFYIQFAKNDKYFLNVAGIKSPGIAAAPAIAEYVIDMIKKVITLKEKENWISKEENILLKN